VQVLAECANGTETSVSSAIRDLRKKRCGAHIVIRRRGKCGLSEYCLLPGGHALKLEGSEATHTFSPATPDAIMKAIKHGETLRLVVST
jgi:DNA integrity scanning protein DisA with diadenylate cyclase activity